MKNLPKLLFLKISNWFKILKPDSNLADKNKFLDIIYWGRQIIAIIMGIIWAYLGLLGFFGIISFCLINSFIVYIYSIKVNNNHEDLFEYVKEGFMTAFSSFIVTWIMVYSAINF